MAKQLKIQMTVEDLRWIEKAAERCGTSPSELLRTAFYDYIFRMDEQDVSAIADRVYEGGAA